MSKSHLILSLAAGIHAVPQQAIVAAVALMTGAALIPLLLRRRAARRARRDAELAAQWQWALHRRHAGGMRLGYVKLVYQPARRGCKALVAWDGEEGARDTWFWFRHLRAGVHVLAAASTGWGPHNQHPGVRYVEYHDVVAVVPDAARLAWMRAQAVPPSPGAPR